MTDALAGPRILVVEDDPGMRQYLSRCLEALQARVVEVSDGSEALTRLREEGAFDLVITDVKMSRLGGEALILAIDLDPELRGLPVLVVTGSCDDAPAVGRPVLRKPFGPSLLRTFVREILGSG